MNYKYDIELFIKDVKSILTTNLNNKITAINTEKNNQTDETSDNFSISLIPTNGYYFQQLPDVRSYQHFVIYGLYDIKIRESLAGGHLQDVSIFIEVVLADTGDIRDKSQIYKLLRYTRSLQEVFNENFDKIRGYGQLKIESLPPTIIQVDGTTLNSSGVVVTASFDV
jgi:hypothetical protein